MSLRIAWVVRSRELRSQPFKLSTSPYLLINSFCDHEFRGCMSAVCICKKCTVRSGPLDNKNLLWSSSSLNRRIGVCMFRMNGSLVELDFHLASRARCRACRAHVSFRGGLRRRFHNTKADNRRRSTVETGVTVKSTELLYHRRPNKT